MCWPVCMHHHISCIVCPSTSSHAIVDALACCWQRPHHCYGHRCCCLQPCCPSLQHLHFCVTAALSHLVILVLLCVLLCHFMQWMLCFVLAAASVCSLCLYTIQRVAHLLPAARLLCCCLLACSMLLLLLDSLRCSRDCKCQAMSQRDAGDCCIALLYESCYAPSDSVDASRADPCSLFTSLEKWTPSSPSL